MVRTVTLFAKKSLSLFNFEVGNRCHCLVLVLANTLSNTLPTMDQHTERSDTMLPTTSVPLS